MNLSQQQEYKIMVLIANRGQNQNSAGISVKALLPKEQDKFYGEFKRSVHLYKEKVSEVSSLWEITTSYTLIYTKFSRDRDKIIRMSVG